MIIYLKHINKDSKIIELQRATRLNRQKEAGAQLWMNLDTHIPTVDRYSMASQNTFAIEGAKGVGQRSMSMADT